MKPGTIIELPDGRVGTVVYHGLYGYGIKWGQWVVPVERILRLCPLFNEEIPEDMRQWEPEAYLREPGSISEADCVGEEFTILAEADK